MCRSPGCFAEDRREPGDVVRDGLVTFNRMEEPSASSAAADKLMIPQGNFRFTFRMEKPKQHLSSSLLPFNHVPDQ